jgi:hypothetical protein
MLGIQEGGDSDGIQDEIVKGRVERCYIDTGVED